MFAAVGTFDGVHLGHQALVSQVRQCAQASQMMPAIFTFSRHPLEIVAPEKAPKVLTPPAEKECLLMAAGAERVIMLDFDENMRSLSAREFMSMLRDEYGVRGLVVGFNHRFGKGREGDFEHCQELGRELGIDVVKGREEVLEISNHQLVPVSSSDIRIAISHQQIDRANAMLGRPYRIHGIVAHGRGIGHTIGWPTANLEPVDSRQLIPAFGVYAAYAHLSSGEKYPAMVNIGHRPTIAEGLRSTIEANIINYRGDLYGQPLTLDFVAFVRAEQRFDSLSALSAQLSVDRAHILSLLSADKQSLTITLMDASGIPLHSIHREK